MSLQDANIPNLSPNDQRLLDALVDSGFDPSALEGLSDAERTRVDALTGMFGLLHDYPVDDPDETLIYATLARIDRYEEQQEARLVLANASEQSKSRWRGLGFRMPDFIAVAASLLLAASILWPVMHSMRQRAIDMACANNMRNVAYAFSAYAADNQGALPVAQAAALGGSWDRVSNAINLKPLLEGQYCSHGHLNCPGNHDNLQMGYSYQWQRSNEPIIWGARIMVVMGDRNPLMDAARANRFLPAMTMSPDHRGRGQNVLTSDGSTMWLGDEPIVGQADNIWLPHGARQLMPGAKPQTSSDVFLAH